MTINFKLSISEKKYVTRVYDVYFKGTTSNWQITPEDPLEYSYEFSFSFISVLQANEILSK